MAFDVSMCITSRMMADGHQKVPGLPWGLCTGLRLCCGVGRGVDGVPYIAGPPVGGVVGESVPTLPAVSRGFDW